MNDNGQMHVDYLLGIAIFLVSIIFVFSYTTGIFTPFRSNSDEVTLLADRISINIVEQTLSAQEPGTYNILNDSRTIDFFSGFNADYEYMIDHFGLNGTYLRYDLNVTMEKSDGTIYAAGKKLPMRENIGQTKRVVLLRDENSGNVQSAILSVRVW
ncbi:MAG: hypothetical protein H5T43_06735 [Methanomethylovorans sp.]|jgi:hypothetical protein|nr:hypothetical protein [Methanomethylovorans sp.]